MEKFVSSQSLDTPHETACGCYRCSLLPAPSSLLPAPMNTRRLLQRFLRYVKIDTTARMDAKTYPSSPGQLRLGRLLVRELKAMGIEDARQDEFGIVLATVPATVAEPRARPSPSARTWIPRRRRPAKA